MASDLEITGENSVPDLIERLRLLRNAVRRRQEQQRREALKAAMERMMRTDEEERRRRRIEEAFLTPGEAIGYPTEVRTRWLSNKTTIACPLQYNSRLRQLLCSNNPKCRDGEVRRRLEEYSEQ